MAWAVFPVQSLSHTNEAVNKMRITRNQVCSLLVTEATSAPISCLQYDKPKEHMEPKNPQMRSLKNSEEKLDKLDCANIAAYDRKVFIAKLKKPFEDVTPLVQKEKNNISGSKKMPVTLGLKTHLQSVDYIYKITSALMASTFEKGYLSMSMMRFINLHQCLIIDLNCCGVNLKF
ncbi:unnamed protein product [Mytilus edulis]|uniref:Uncharacterized protein n=1 Tax=Mytilus edulis TaxID=6550 RepID=A0A8S3TN16_MYTED|nr:unnamed protein product [Mytilus edulis]